MMVRTNHDFMGHKEQVAKRQSCFGSFYFTLGFRNAVLGSFCVLFCFVYRYLQQLVASTMPPY